MLKLKESTKIELWIFTGFITLALAFSITQTIINFHNSIEAPYPPNIWSQLLFSYIITTICYLLLALYVQKEFEKPDEEVSNAVTFIYILIYACFLTSFVDSYFAILLSIKMLIIYFTRNKLNQKNQFYNELTMLLACVIFIHAGIALLNIGSIILQYLTFILPIAICHYLYAMYVILPRILFKKYIVLPAVKFRKYRFIKYIGNTLLMVIASFVPLLIILFVIVSNRGYNVEQLMALNIPTQLIIVPFLAWNIFKARNEKKAEEIQSLKTELGKSDANLNFLKSQINPHFLFNALNTIYGTALQENAERTGEGIQKLGDMMRFMLQENMEDKIFLSRDIDYLNNYIDLQKLRISTSSEIIIETQIEEQINNFQITPMLLIPFVENAFKHGISLQHPSHIKITLQVSNNKLYFDVHNSIHIKHENDPEKLQSGVGLQNVKQRLALLYPNQYELIIRENAKEFFIHLTLQLTGVQN